MNKHSLIVAGLVVAGALKSVSQWVTKGMSYILYLKGNSNANPLLIFQLFKSNHTAVLTPALYATVQE